MLKGYSPKEIEDMLSVLKIISFKKGECICEKNSPMDQLLWVVYGRMRIGKNAQLTKLQEQKGERIIYLQIGDMLGYQNLAEQNGPFMEQNWKYDIYADSDGYVAVLPFGEIKTEIRRSASALQKVYEIAANYAYETTHYNLTGTSSNPVIKF